MPRRRFCFSFLVEVRIRSISVLAYSTYSLHSLDKLSLQRPITKFRGSFLCAPALPSRCANDDDATAPLAKFQVIFLLHGLSLPQRQTELRERTTEQAVINVDTAACCSVGLLAIALCRSLRPEA